jgi:tetratricopeptide (TPR) repeat protein
MNPSSFRQPQAATPGGGVAFLEAESGAHRTAVLDEWSKQARHDGMEAIYVSAVVDELGVWAGLSGLLESQLPHMREVAPELVQRHSYELCLVLPALRRELTVENPCLTDTSVGQEKVRNYPNDRAYRSLHGLIDLLDEWSQVAGQYGWAVACDHFDRATPLVQRFFAELLRRRGEAMGLSLLLAISPGTLGAAAALFDRRLGWQTVSMECAPLESWQPSPEEAGRMAAALEQQVGDDEIEWSLQLPSIIRLWQHSHTPDRALPWLVRAVNLYDHDGLYEISLHYAPVVEASFDRMFALDRNLHGRAVINLFFCYAALGRADDALRILETEGVPRVQDPALLAEIHYFLAMLHARFLSRRDQQRAERHLDLALQYVAEQDISAARRHFLHVFIRNGLAYVRLKQGRVDESLALCRSGLEELNVHLPPGQHRLHRSVLLYNAAQVLSGLNRRAEAIHYYTNAMQMDPNYSEYYLERGGLYLKLERYPECERDLRRAIQLSPPYAEVWTDLGQCYRAQGRWAEAQGAYSRALDLDPRVGLALIGRAEAFVELLDFSRAVEDYTAALALEPEQAMLFAGRAVAQFEAGLVADALRDLDRAIELEPDTAELYQNRAVALTALGQVGDAEHDLEQYLRLAPQAEDRADVEAQLGALRAA